MKTLRNAQNGNFATIVNKGNYGFTVYFGYSHGTNDAYGNETCTAMKTYKSEKTANKKAQEYIN
jgi:hypothetical protein